MGLFICVKGQSEYKNQRHTKIETELVDTFGFQQITQDNCNKIVKLILKVENDKQDKFCKSINTKGESLGIETSTVVAHTTGDETVLILSTKNNIEEITSGNDIRAILTFNYEDEEDKYLDLTALCSNQVTKSGGGRVLIENLINVCKQEGIMTIGLLSSDSAIEFYKFVGFVSESEVHRKMLSLKLGRGKYRKRFILNLKNYSRKNYSRKRYKIQKLKNYGNYGNRKNIKSTTSKIHSRKKLKSKITQIK